MASTPRWAPLVAARIRKAIRQSPWSETYVSDESGISLATLRRRLRGTTSWTLAEVEAVAKVLNTDPDDFLKSNPDRQSEAS